MSARVLLNLLNELGKKIRCEALPSILPVFPDEFNKFNNTGARMQSKTISNDRELIQSDPTSCPQNQKGNN